MPIDPSVAVGAELPEVTFSWTASDVALYHLAVGAARDPLDADGLRRRQHLGRLRRTDRERLLQVDVLAGLQRRHHPVRPADVAGEDAGGGMVGALVEDECEVERTGCLDARRDSGGPEPQGRGDALVPHEPRVIAGGAALAFSTAASAACISTIRIGSSNLSRPCRSR